MPCALTHLAAGRRGRDRRVERQLPLVARFGPDLVSVTVGMNDIREPGFSQDRFDEQFGRLLGGLILTGATVLTCTLPDIATILPLPAGMIGLARQRMRQASDTIREQAAARGALCLDAWSMPAAADPGLFGPYWIHPNAGGHRLLATACADLLLAGAV